MVHCNICDQRIFQKNFLNWLYQYLLFSIFPFSKFCPMENCGLPTLHCLYHDSLTLMGSSIHLWVLLCFTKIWIWFCDFGININNSFFTSFHGLWITKMFIPPIFSGNTMAANNRIYTNLFQQLMKHYMFLNASKMNQADFIYLRIWCPFYHITSWRKPALIQKSSNQNLKL